MRGVREVVVVVEEVGVVVEGVVGDDVVGVWEVVGVGVGIGFRIGFGGAALVGGAEVAVVAEGANNDERGAEGEGEEGRAHLA